MKQLKYIGAYILTTLLMVTFTFMSINKIVVLSKLTTNHLDIANAITTAIITQLIITLVLTYISYHLILDSSHYYNLYKTNKRLEFKHTMNRRRHQIKTHNHITKTIKLDRQVLIWLSSEPNELDNSIETYNTAWEQWIEEYHMLPANATSELLEYILRYDTGSHRLRRYLTGRRVSEATKLEDNVSVS